jgi:hypothetical protein
MNTRIITRIIITGRNNTLPIWAFSGLSNSGTTPESAAGGTRQPPSCLTVTPGDFLSPSPGVIRPEVW